MVELVGNLKDCHGRPHQGQQLDERADQEGRARASFAKMDVMVGYPDKFRDYSALKIDADDLYGNVERASRFNADYAMEDLGKPVDHKKWVMNPQTVNAYNGGSENKIVFPAGILQPPFFDPAADDAVNYGAIGAVIGHEISHGFDDQGRKFDAHRRGPRLVDRRGRQALRRRGQGVRRRNMPSSRRSPARTSTRS